MIPEIGHFALILALLIASVQAALPIAGAARGDRVWMSVARPAARGQAFFVTFAWLCLAYSFVNNDFSVLNVATNSNSQLPAAVQDRGQLGLARRLDAAVDADARVVDVRGSDLLEAPAGRNGRARDRCAGPDFGRLPAVHADDVGSLRPAVPAGARRPRSEPAAAGPGHGCSSADALHGIRRHVGRLRIRDRSLARRQTRRRVGALVAAVDDDGMVLPDARHHDGKLVGVLRAGLGRLVVLGSGRERIVHAVAGRHRADPLARSHRKARQLPQLDRAAGDLDLFAVAARHLPRPLGGADLGARLCHRPAPRRVHPRLSRARHRLLAGAVCLACAEGRPRRQVRPRLARVIPADEQRAAGGRLCLRAAGHAVSAVPRRAQPRQDLGRSAVLRLGVRADHGAAGVPDGRRAAGALEEGRDSRPGDAPALGAGRELRDRDDRAVPRGPLDAVDRVRTVPRLLGHRLGRRRHQGARATPQGRTVGATRRPGPRVLGHAVRALRRGRVHHRRDAGERL